MDDEHYRQCLSQIVDAEYDETVRNTTAAALSKIAAKAEGKLNPARLLLPEPKAHAPRRCRPLALCSRTPHHANTLADDVLEELATYSHAFVGWLEAEQPLVRAYTACILANIAFLEPGQQKVLEAGGVAPLVRMLKGKEDAKVTLHSTAAVQNLTYKNTACCSEVLDHGGEKALKKLLQHKKEDIQQFAAGALANLQLYRRKAEELSPEGGAMPRSSMGRKVAKILRRKGGGGGGGGGQGAPMPNNMGPSYSSGQQIHEAAMVIQAQYRGNAARKHFEQNRMRGGGGGGGSKFGGMMRGVGGGPGGGGSKYDAFSIRDVRKELGAMGMGPGGMQENVNPGQRTYGLPSLSSLGGGGGGPSALMKLGGPGGAPPKLPARLAPLGQGGGGPGGGLPGLGAGGGHGLAPLGGVPGGLGLPPPSGLSAAGGFAGLRPPPANMRRLP